MLASYSRGSLCSTKYPPGWTARKPKFTGGSIRSGSRNTSPSSWTATGAGPSGATCRALPDTAPEWPPCARRSRLRRASAFPRSRSMHFPRRTGRSVPQSEVDFLMGLLSRYLKAEVPTLNENNIRLEYIGRQQELPEDVQERMEWARESTAHNTGMVLTLALNYSARSELVDAFRSMVNAAAQNGGIEHLADRRGDGWRASLHAASARSRSGGAHLGRDAAEQLPAVAVGLRRDLCDADAVARLPRRASAGRHCRVSEARAALRRLKSRGCACARRT